MFEICSDLSKTGLKIYFFCQHSKKAKKRPNGQIFLFLANKFKKGQIWQIWPLKRPNDNPGSLWHRHLLLIMTIMSTVLPYLGKFPHFGEILVQSGEFFNL